MPRITTTGQHFVISPKVGLCCGHKRYIFTHILNSLFVAQSMFNMTAGANGCTIEKRQPTIQEHERTAKLKDNVVHRGDLEDKVLNTAQMRDANILQKFRIQVPLLSPDVVLEETSAREWRTLNKPKPRTSQTPNLPTSSTAHQKPPVMLAPTSLPTQSLPSDLSSPSASLLHRESFIPGPSYGIRSARDQYPLPISQQYSP